MFYSGHRIAILSTNNPIIKKTEASPRFVKRRRNSSIFQEYFENHLQCSQLSNMITFTDLIVSAFNTCTFTVRNDVQITDSKLRNVVSDINSFSAFFLYEDSYFQVVSRCKNQLRYCREQALPRLPGSRAQVSEVHARCLVDSVCWTRNAKRQ